MLSLLPPPAFLSSLCDLCDRAGLVIEASIELSPANEGTKEESESDEEKEDEGA